MLGEKGGEGKEGILETACGGLSRQSICQLGTKAKAGGGVGGL